MSRSGKYMFFVIFLWLLSSAFGFFFLKSVDPSTAKIWQMSLLYLLIFVWVYSALTILGYGFRYIFWSKDVSGDHLLAAKRQASLFGFLAVILLILQSANILNLKIMILLVVIFILLELYSL